ncbi:MAG TPA: hypothetical protein VL588_04545, partial [Bdellovibrionota bacterium]|nr:hypothetical protein [Bdellovibrionota bacterium]
MSVTSPFLFTTCQVGAAPTLKKEMARIAPNLRFAFSRAGFLTFKSPKPLADDYRLDAVFARAYGLSLGKVGADPAAVVAKAKELGGGKPVRLHFWERDFYAHGKLPLGYELGQMSDAHRAVLDGLKRDPIFLDGFKAEPGDLVLDVVVVELDEWWIGCHRHTEAHSPWPGGWPSIPLPPESPSRAYLKLEEAVQLTAVPFRA